ncbi:hypothetical protein RHGRI_030579 [Rhododendron griersonianum]|uniref:Uncharacterized protein n=1 Tax=Rhododendron griersonianum TaxID=479676 RepID=A0AAV6INM0_9ERIC|nr:hypothetical protein RHGRI_030579 [Rhododendron griersonianum]
MARALGAWGEFTAAREAVHIHVPPSYRPPQLPNSGRPPLLERSRSTAMLPGRTLLTKVGGALSSGTLEDVYLMVGDFVSLLIRLSLQRPLFLEKHASLPKP